MAERDGIWSRGGSNVEELPDPFAPLPPPPAEFIEQVEAPKPRRWRRRLKIGLYALTGLIVVTLIWLIVTAPLSRALEPLDDPAMLLVS